MKKNVVGVIVTYNRLLLLQNCIESLKNQTEKLDEIIIVNNGSTDATKEWLDQQDGLIVFHQENSGGAGGFHKGIYEAHYRGFSWIWIMDDDCVADPNCLNQMFLSLEKNYSHCVAPIVLNSEGSIEISHRGNFKLSVMAQSILTPISFGNEEDLFVDFASFVGLMINATVITEIGLPNKDFFIHYDDLEYCLRINKFCRILLSAKAKIFHLENALNKNVKKTFLNHFRYRPSIDNLWIRYYGVRNLIWIKKEYIVKSSISGKVKLLSFILKSLSQNFKDIILYDDFKLKRAGFYIEAFKDGWGAIFDNEKPKRKLK